MLPSHVVVAGSSGNFPINEDDFLATLVLMLREGGKDTAVGIFARAQAYLLLLSNAPGEYSWRLTLDLEPAHYASLGEEDRAGDGAAPAEQTPLS